MFSARTNVEIAFAIERMNKASISRMLIAFSLESYMSQELSNAKLANIFLEFLKIQGRRGPFTDSFTVDVLQYVVDNFYRDKKKEDYWRNDPVHYDDLFAFEFPLLTNSLKRDGYIFKGPEIRKVLPEEIDEAQVETELIRQLTKFGFTQSKSHLEQAINNHSSAQWESANAQFRTFIESLLTEICFKLSGRACADAGQAITSLSNLSPAFLNDSLNEVKSNSNGIEVGFVNGLWKRLHPNGSHPGISDEEDCTFRYHIGIVFANYLLKRLAKRLNISI